MSEHNEPSWKRFENFDDAGTNRCEAMRAWHQKRIRSSRSGHSGGDLTSGTPRKTKYGRNTRIEGLHLR